MIPPVFRDHVIDVNSLHKVKSAMLQVMACPIVVITCSVPNHYSNCYQLIVNGPLDPYELTAMKFESKYQTIC